MAKYDQGGGCSCGLMRVCDCQHNLQADGTKARPEKKVERPNCFGTLLFDYHKEFPDPVPPTPPIKITLPDYSPKNDSDRGNGPDYYYDDYDD